MTREEVKKILAKLTIMYPHFTVGEAIAGFKPTDVWYEVIGDMDYAKADKAVQACMQRCKYPPTAADIREEYDKILSTEKRAQADILRYYEMTRSYFPGSGEIDNGKSDFLERAKTPEQAARLYAAVVQYVNGCTDNTILFDECIKTIKF